MVGVLAAFLASFSWALAAVLYRKALTGFSDPWITNGLRAAPTLLFLLLLAVVIGKIDDFYFSLTNIHDLTIIFVATIVAIVVGDTLYMIALRNVGVSIGYPISFMYPVFVAFLASFILEEVITFTLIVSLFLASIGVWLVSYKAPEQKTPLGKRKLVVGVISAMGASSCWAIAIVIFRISVRTADPLAVDALKILFLLIVFLPLLVVKFNDIKANVDRKTFFVLSLGGILGIGVGDWFLYISLAEIGAARATALTTSAPLLSLFLAVLVLKEKVSKRQFLGTILIIIGVILVSVTEVLR